MPTGYSLSIGLNRIDASHYGSEGILRNPVNDARAMAQIVRGAGIKNSNVLLDDEATTDEVAAIVRGSLRRAQPGDLVVITYSGHGSQIPDASGLEEDGLDETLCLYDRMMPGAEFHRLLALFAEGVRILVIVDACHSRTFVRGLWVPGTSPPERRKSLLRSDALAIYSQHRALYDELRRDPVLEIKASVIALSACQDGQLASDGAGDNGAFTAGLLKALNASGNYQQLVNEIGAEMGSPTQTPAYRSVTWADPEFETQVPFSV